MTSKTYLHILPRIAGIAYAVQFASQNAAVASALGHAVTAAIAGIGILIAEVLLIKSQLGAKAGMLWAPATLQKVGQALAGFGLVLAVTTMLVRHFEPNAVVGSYDDLPRYLFIFLINTLPNAWIEEWVFRFCPRLLSRGSSLTRPLLIYLGATVIFTLMHLPKFYFDGHLAGLSQVFVAGIIFFIIYFATGNLLFVALVHAFTNRAWFVHDATSNWFSLYISITAVTLLWAALRAIRQRRAMFHWKKRYLYKRKLYIDP